MCYKLQEQMEWQLPIQKVELSHINIGSPWARDKYMSHKPMAPLSYFGTQFRLPFITLLFPPLPVVEYVPQTGRLVLDMSGSALACIKLNTLQETIVNAILYHQHAWFKTDFSKEDVKGGFQPIIERNQIILHCPSTVRSIPIYKDGEWLKEYQPAEILQPGMRIRVATKLHGISFLTKPDAQQEWTGRCRLQHRIQGIIFTN